MTIIDPSEGTVASSIELPFNDPLRGHRCFRQYLTPPKAMFWLSVYPQAEFASSFNEPLRWRFKDFLSTTPSEGSVALSITFPFNDQLRGHRCFMHTIAFQRPLRRHRCFRQYLAPSKAMFWLTVFSLAESCPTASVLETF